MLLNEHLTPCVGFGVVLGVSQCWTPGEGRRRGSECLIGRMVCKPGSLSSGLCSLTKQLHDLKQVTTALCLRMYPF